MAAMTGTGRERTGPGTPAALAALGEAAFEACVATIQAGIAAFCRGRAVSAIAGEVDRLEEALLAHQYAESTAKKYALTVIHFLEVAGGRPDHGDVVAYLDLLSESRSNAVLRVTLCAIRAVFDRILGWGITEGIRHVPPPAPRPAATPSQVAQLQACAGSGQAGQVVDVLYELGLLPCEARLLGWRAGDAGTEGSGTEERQPRFRAASGDGDGREREYRVQPGEIPGTVWLFPSPGRSTALSTRTLQRRVRALGLRCGFHVTCTAIRLAARAEAQVAA